MAATTVGDPYRHLKPWCRCVAVSRYMLQNLGTLYITTASRKDPSPSDASGGLFAVRRSNNAFSSDTIGIGTNDYAFEI